MIVKTQEISFNVEMESLKLSDGITLGDQVQHIIHVFVFAALSNNFFNRFSVKLDLR